MRKSQVWMDHNGKHQTSVFVITTGQWEGCGQWFYCYSVNTKIIHEGRRAFAKFVEFHCWNKCENVQRLFMLWFDLEKNEQISIDSMVNFSFEEKWWHFHSLNVKFLQKSILNNNGVWNAFWTRMPSKHNGTTRCKGLGCYHSASKTGVTDRIFKSSPIHASVIINFPEFAEFSESSAPFRENSNSIFTTSDVSI